ncbi:MAG: polymer-forming cytoskeletal protein [bacterium]
MKITKILLIFVILLLFPIAIYAQSEKISGNFFKVDNTIKITQEIDGDVIVLAENLIIDAKVHGDVLALAENIEINAEIEGDARVAAKNVIINSKIYKNVNIFASNTEILKGAILEKDLIISSGKIKTLGTVNGDIKGIFLNAEIGGIINGNMEIEIEDEGKLILYPETLINGNLNYTSKNGARIEPSAKINGEVTHKEQKKTHKVNYFGKIISLFSMIALGMVFLFIDKKDIMNITHEIITHPNKSLLWGILYFFAIPLLSIILIFTIIGMPLALIFIAIYAILLYTSQVIIATAIGNAITKNRYGQMTSIIFGITIFIIFTGLPWIGSGLKLLAIFIGMGAIVNMKRNSLRGRK